MHDFVIGNVKTEMIATTDITSNSPTQERNILTNATIKIEKDDGDELHLRKELERIGIITREESGFMIKIEEDNLSLFGADCVANQKKNDGDCATDELGLAEESPKKVFKCPFCIKAYSDKLEMKIHSTTHIKSKQLQCGECNLKFSSARCFETHNEVHKKLAEPPIECFRCCRRFWLEADLEEHKLYAKTCRAWYLTVMDVDEKKVREDSSAKEPPESKIEKDSHSIVVDETKEKVVKSSIECAILPDKPAKKLQSGKQGRRDVRCLSKTMNVTGKKVQKTTSNAGEASDKKVKKGSLYDSSLAAVGQTINELREVSNTGALDGPKRKLRKDSNLTERKIKTNSHATRVLVGPPEEEVHKFKRCVPAAKDVSGASAYSSAVNVSEKDQNDSGFSSLIEVPEETSWKKSQLFSRMKDSPPEENLRNRSIVLKKKEPKVISTNAINVPKKKVAKVSYNFWSSLPVKRGWNSSIEHSTVIDVPHKKTLKVIHSNPINTHEKRVRKYANCYSSVINLPGKLSQTHSTVINASRENDQKTIYSDASDDLKEKVKEDSHSYSSYVIEKPIHDSKTRLSAIHARDQKIRKILHPSTIEVPKKMSRKNPLYNCCYCSKPYVSQRALIIHEGIHERLVAMAADLVSPNGE